MHRFFVAGDLNLTSGQKLFGVGNDLIKLEVGNNANIASTATIDFSGEGQFNGAGGGRGGDTSPTRMASSGLVPAYSSGTGNFTVVPRGPRGGFGGGVSVGGVTRERTGETGASTAGLYFGFNQDFLNAGFRVVPGSAEYGELFDANGGGAGGVGAGNLASTSGAVGIDVVGTFG